MKELRAKCLLNADACEKSHPTRTLPISFLYNYLYVIHTLCHVMFMLVYAFKDAKGAVFNSHNITDKVADRLTGDITLYKDSAKVEGSP